MAPFPKKRVPSSTSDGIRHTTEPSASSRSVVLDRGSIEAKALNYLDRFDSSVSRLRRVLTDFVKRRAGELGVDPAPHLQTVDATLQRYQASGLLDDRRYGAAMARSLVERGASRQAIRTKLFGRGIGSDIIDNVLRELGEQEGSELSAARALVRKRKLGMYRESTERRDQYRRDLGILARAGFDFDTAKRALAVEGGVDDDEAF